MTPKKNNNDFDAEIENDDLKQAKAETEIQDAEEEVIVKPRSSYKNNASTMDFDWDSVSNKGTGYSAEKRNRKKSRMDFIR